MPVANGRNPLPNLRWKLFLNPLRTHPGNVLNYNWGGSRQGNDQPHETGERESGERNEFQQMSIAWIKVSDSAKSDEKEQCRNTGDDD
jgi:hypothetical protein